MSTIVQPLVARAFLLMLSALAAACGGSSGAGGGGECAPYPGSYSGILTYQSKDCTSGASATQTIAVHFVMACNHKAGNGQIELNVTSASADQPYFGASTLTPTTEGGAVVPGNPPTSGDWTSDIQLSFPSLQGNGAHKLIDMRGPLTVTSGAAIIADDPTNPVGPGGGSVSGAFWTIDGGSTQYNCEGTQSYPVLPWLPTGSNVESATYKVDHD